MMTQADDHWIATALAEAEAAAARGEVPVGAVLVGTEPSEMLAAAGNAIVETHDPTAHAEMLVIREAARRIGNERLVGATLYVTLEPCAMCAGAIAQARVSRLVYGAADPKGGAVESGVRYFDQPTCHWRPDIAGGVMAAESASLLKAFFRARR